MSTQLSKLEAVNMSLTAIGLAPATSLADPTVDVDLERAYNILENTLKEVQSEGWAFNTEEEYELEPDSSTKKIRVPDGVFTLDFNNYDWTDVQPVRRGQFLYDRANRTFEFDSSVTGEAVVFLDWDDLPFHAQWYIAVRAARKFTTESTSSRTKDAFTRQDEREARRLFRSRELKMDDTHFLGKGWKPMGLRRSHRKWR